MTEATRAVALSEAIKLLGFNDRELDVEVILSAAIKFNDFLVSDTKQPQNPPKTSVAGAEPSKPVKQPKATKPVKPAKPETEINPEEDAAAELAEQDEDESDDIPAGAAIPNSLDGVKEVVALMLAANKRKEAVGLLKKFKAASATSVKPKDFAAFIAEAKEIAGPAEEADGDLTA